jgi:hypothetical protein
MPRALLSPSFALATPLAAIALLIAQPSAAFAGMPVAAATMSARIVPIGQVVSLADPGVALTRPRDGRLRGYGYSAQVAGVAAVDTAGPISAPISAGPHRHLVVFALYLTTYPTPQDIGDGTATLPFTADVALDGNYLPIGTLQMSSARGGTYAVSVPNGHGDVDFELTAANLTSSFSLTTLHRVGTQPAVLYRDPIQPSLTVKVDQSQPVPVEAPPDYGPSFSGEEILGVMSATLSDFEPGDPAVQPSDPGDAFLAITGTDGEDPDPAPGYPTGSGYVDGFSALPPGALTLTLPGGQAVSAARSGSSGGGLLSGTYYFIVPADLTSVTLSVAPGTVSGVVYYVFTGVNQNVTFSQPAVFTIDFPPSPAGPITSTSTSTIPVVHNDPTPGLVSGAPRAVRVNWLIPVGAAVLLGTGIGLFRGRRTKRRSGSDVNQHPYRPLVPLAPWRRIDITSVAPSAAPPALGPGPQPPPPDNPNSASERSNRRSLPATDGALMVASPRHDSSASGTHSVRPLELLVLGPVEVHGWKRRPRRRIVTALLCYLALHPGRPVSGDQLLTALWPLGSSRKEATRASLHTYVSDLRRALPEGMLPDAASSDGYTVTGGVPTDWGTFVELVVQAKDALAHDAAHLRAQALSLVRGAPFAGATTDMYEWVAAEHHLATMEVAITECAHSLSNWRLRTGDAGGAADAARIGLSAVTDSFVLHADMIRSTRAGADPAALRRAWRAARSALGAEGVAALLNELGGDPSLHGAS